MSDKEITKHLLQDHNCENCGWSFIVANKACMLGRSMSDDICQKWISQGEMQLLIDNIKEELKKIEGEKTRYVYKKPIDSDWCESYR